MKGLLRLNTLFRTCSTIPRRSGRSTRHSAVFYKEEIGWMCGEPNMMQFMVEFCDGEGNMKLANFPRILARANEIFPKS